MAMRNHRKKPTNVWADKALILASKNVDKRRARSEDDLTAAAREIVLGALFGKWRTRSPGEDDELSSLLPEPPRRDSNDLFGADALFRFAGLAETLMDYSITAGPKGGAKKSRAARSKSRRKAQGMFFTPYELATQMVDQCLSPVLGLRSGPIDELLSLRVLDPAMGTGRFLLAAAERIIGEAAPGEREEILDLRRKVVDTCLFGVDRSAFAIRAALCMLGLYTDRDLADGLPNLRVGDSLVRPDAAHDFAWEGGFPESFFPSDDAGDEKEFDGFDVIVGNPPYVASKNEPASFYAPYLGKAGQSDYYLLFIHKYVRRKYLRPGGAVSFVVPDPILCRHNAESVRLRLLEEVDLEGLIHARGLFAELGVANVVFLARRPEGPRREKRESLSLVKVARLESPAECRRYFQTGAKGAPGFVREIPREFFRRTPGKEFRYLLPGGAEKVVERLDTTLPPPSGQGVVVRSLGSIAKARGSIFRGEEIGKEKIRSLMRHKAAGGVPVLLGGENIARFSIRDDGFLIPPDAVRKDLSRYRRQKILLQKSTGRLVAALDSKGFVFPQSVYGVVVNDSRIGYAFVLAQLNSHLINYFLHVMFTGYKLVQPQIEIEDIKRLPVIVPEFAESAEARQPSLETAKGLYRQFLETGDPGWVLEYLEESLKIGSNKGSALIHDLLEYLGTRMIESASSPADQDERQPLEWLIDLMIYRICGLDVDEVELVENFFSGEVPDSASLEFARDDPERRDRALWKKGEAHLYGGDGSCTS